jgi:hypothetical protein
MQYIYMRPKLNNCLLKVMLMNPNFNEARKSRVVLLESSECAQVFEDFLKYLYTGRLTLQLPSVLHVLILADKYNVKVKCFYYIEY